MYNITEFNGSVQVFKWTCFYLLPHNLMSNKFDKKPLARLDFVLQSTQLKDVLVPFFKFNSLIPKRIKDFYYL